MPSASVRVLAVLLATSAACKSEPRQESPALTELAPPIEAPAEPEPEAEPPAPRVVLVTIDGVRWQDVFEGGDPALAPRGELDAFADPDVLTPRLQELAAKGIALGATREGCGVVRAHGTSSLSLPGYLEILTGRATSCRSNVCARVDAPTILDEAARAGVEGVASIASWEIMDRAASRGTEGVLVSAGARPWPISPATPRLDGLVRHATRLGPFPAPSGAYRPDSATSTIALEYVRTASPRFVHVGLGDTDEWAHRGNYVEYLKALHEADAFVGELVDSLARDGLLDATTILVTTDHGRARDFRTHGGHPEARRAFLVAYGRAISRAGTQCASRDVELIDIGATIRVLLGLPNDPRPDAGVPIRELLEP